MMEKGMSRICRNIIPLMGISDRFAMDSVEIM